MLLALALPAFAALPTFADVGYLLTAPTEGAFAGGVNAPTVAWDGAQWVMYFESPAVSSEVPSDCSSSYRIGRATSPDGLVWTIDETPVLVPDRADSTLSYNCSVAQPAVVFDGTTWHMFFSMGDEKANSAGSNVNAGIGYATSADGTTFTVVEAPSGPAVLTASGGDTGTPTYTETRSTLGMASAVLVEDEILVMFVGSGELFLGRLDTTTGQWTLVEDPAIAKGVDPDWMGGNLFSPALNCDLSTGLTAYFGAFTDSTAAVRNFGLATSTDGGLAWTVDGDAPFSSSAVPFADINHIETVVSGSDTLLYYSMTDSATGLKAIGLATTGTGGTPGGRVCVTAVDTGDTGDTGTPDTGDTGTPDTGDTGDTGTTDTADSGDTADTGTTDTAADTGDTGDGGAEDTGGADDKGGCGCTPVGDPVGAGAVAMGLAALAARRRRRA